MNPSAERADLFRIQAKRLADAGMVVEAARLIGSADALDRSLLPRDPRSESYFHDPQARAFLAANNLTLAQQTEANAKAVKYGEHTHG